MEKESENRPHHGPSTVRNELPDNLRRYRFLAVTITLAVLMALFLTWLVNRNLRSMQDLMMVFVPKAHDHYLTYDVTPEKLNSYNNKLKKDLAVLNRKMRSYTPGQYYLVVNTSDNEFVLMKGSDTARSGICSTGSYTLLKTEGEKEWIFKTPRGMFRIRGKIENPSWRKPDWAFVEEGLPVPPPNDPSRIEYGVLGDYAMSIGNGYLIHGTLYKRFLGMPVTHGCIRLGDDDLEAIFKSMQTGSKVYIY